MKLLDPASLARGTARQRQALAALNENSTFEKLASYQPVLAGTIPIDIDIESSDLDIILSAANLETCAQDLQRHFGDEPKFRLVQKIIRDWPTVIARFEAHGFPFEIFAQDRSPLIQPAVLHMLVEARLLAFAPSEAREKIRELKRSGLKTEPAFAACFDIAGDPYEEILKLAHKTDRDLLTIAHRFLFKPENKPEN